MRVYIAGPMRGHKDLNFPAFFKMERMLRKMGFQVTNPAAVDVACGVKPGKKFSNKAVAGFLLRDLHLLQRCRMVVLLPGWLRSRGAMTEAYFALSVGIPVFQVVVHRGRIIRFNKAELF